MTESFESVWARVPGEGWLEPAEGRLLYAEAGRVGGPILEVGVYKGRSTVLLAALGRPLYCVDPFAGFNDLDPSGERVKADWLHNVRLLTGIEPAVVPAALAGLNSVPDPADKITLWARRVEDWRPRPCGFAYLDGDHTRAGTLAQVRRALECDPTTIAVHDVNDSGDGYEVRKACEELIGPWRERVQKLAVWRLR